MSDKDVIYRQAAIDVLRTCYDTETISMDNGDEYINYCDAVGGIEQLPPAQPRMTCDGCKYANHPTGWSDVCVLCIRNFRNFTDRYEGESDGKN